MKKVENVKNYNGVNKRMTLKALSLLMSGVMATSFGSCDNGKQNETEYATDILAYSRSNNSSIDDLEYHIFGVDEDGNVIESLKDDPRFGARMLGDNIILGDSNGLIQSQLTIDEDLPSLLGSIEITESGQVVNIPVYKNVYESNLPIEQYKDYAGFEHNTYDTYDEPAPTAARANRP